MPGCMLMSARVKPPSSLGSREGDRGTPSSVEIGGWSRVYILHMAARLDPELRRRVSQARVARLATIRSDGYPHIVPVTFAIDGERVVTAIDDKPKTTTDLQRLKNIESHAVASVMVDHYEDDWSRLWWVRGDGSAEIIREGPSRGRAIAQLTAKYSPYQDDPPRGPVIILTIERWASWCA